MSSKVMSSKTATTLWVQLQEQSYPIYIGRHLLAEPQLWLAHLAGRQVMIVSNENIAKWYLAAVQTALAGLQCDVHIVADGEQYKTIAGWESILTALLAHNHHRTTTLIALGGGVIGDLTGFAAACYQRGVRFIQAPTSLLAQVDASIGGKTAVNHALGKNMIGTFYQPAAVIIDVETLMTLPEREYKAGLAEVVKYGLICDAEFFAWLESRVEALLKRDYQALIFAIERSCAIKAEIVRRDERESSGERALLNLGHTFGHAIEQALGYGQWLHGEAVAIGLMMAARYSELAGWLPAEPIARLQAWLLKVGLPLKLPDGLQCDQLLSAMSRDKKISHGQLRLVALKAIGRAFLTEGVDSSRLRRVLVEFCGR